MPATKKKKIGVPVRAMVATACFLLGTLAVLYYGGRGSSGSSKTASSGGILADLLQGYDPNQDFCFADTDNPGKYCWYCYDARPYGNWKGEGGRGYGDCGKKCTNFLEPAYLCY